MAVKQIFIKICNLVKLGFFPKESYLNEYTVG